VATKTRVKVYQIFENGHEEGYSMYTPIVADTQNGCLYFKDDRWLVLWIPPNGSIVIK
jgi:hypothetical protein